MFDTIFKRILLTNLSKFIEGIDENNFKLGVWSGNMAITNVSLKSQFIESWDLPLKMLFSHVGKLSIQVPWKSLSSKPVDIVLEDVFLIIEPIEERAWDVTDYKLLLNRLDLLDQYLDFYAKSDMLLGKKKTSEQQGGNKTLIARIANKIIDNLQVSIKNIHIRFEGAFKERYACGILLNEISIFTTNADWKKEFIDRSKLKSQSYFIKKVMSLKDLAIYWTPEADKFYGGLDREEIKKLMREQILDNQKNQNKKSEYLGVLSADCRLTIKDQVFTKSKDSDEPDLDASIHLSPINFQINKLQTKELSQFLSLLVKRWRLKASSLKKRRLESENILKENKDESIDEFKRMYRKILENQNKEELKEGEDYLKTFLSSDPKADKFKSLALGLPKKDILPLVKEVADEFHKEIGDSQEPDSPDEKKDDKEKSGWFKGLFHRKKKEPKSPTSLFGIIGADDIEKYLAESDVREGITTSEESDDDKSDEGSVKSFRDLKAESIIITLVSPDGTLSLSDTGNLDTEEGVKLNAKGFEVRLGFKSGKVSIRSSLQDCSGWVKTRVNAQSGEYLQVPLFKKANYSDKSRLNNKAFFIQHESGSREAEWETDTTVEIRDLEIAWRPQVIQWIVGFLSVFKKNSKVSMIKQLQSLHTLRTKSKDTLEDQFNLGNRANNLSIKLYSSVIIIPCKKNSTVENDCWTLTVGQLNMDKAFGRNFNVKEVTSTVNRIFYENDQVQVKKVKLEYWPSQVLYEKVNQSLRQQGDLMLLTPQERIDVGLRFKILDEVDFELDIKRQLELTNEHILKGHIANSEYIIDVGINVDNIRLAITPEIITKVSSIEEIIPDELQFYKEAILESSKTDLLQGSLKSGFLFMKEELYGKVSWKKHYCILGQRILYCFEDEEASPSVKPKIKIPLDRKFIEEDKAADQTQPNVFTIEGEGAQYYFSAESVEEFAEWVDNLTLGFRTSTASQKELIEGEPDQILEISPVKKVSSFFANAEKDKLFQPKKTFKASLNNLEICVLRKMDEKLMAFQVHDITFKLEELEAFTRANVKIDSFELVEFLDGNSHALKPFATSKPAQSPELLPFYYKQNNKKSQDSTIEIQVTRINRESYTDPEGDLQVSIQCHYLEVYFRPELVQQAIAALKNLSSTEKARPQQEKSELKVFELSELEKILVNVKLNINEGIFRLFHHSSPVCMGELWVQNTLVDISQKLYSLDIKGSISGLELLDTTNYPYTSELLKDPSSFDLEKVVPFNVLKAQKNNPIEFKYSDYEKQHPLADNENKIFSHLDINVKDLQVQYIQQAFMRLVVEYLDEQFIAAISGELRVNESLIEESMSIESLLQAVHNPSFMKLSVILTNPVIDMKPFPQADECIQIKLDKIEVSNEVLQSDKRLKFAHKHPIKSVWCSRYNISLYNLRLWANYQDNLKKELTIDTFDLSWNVDLLAFVAKYKEILKPYSQHHIKDSPTTKRGDEDEKILDSTLRIQGLFKAPLQLAMTHQDYLLFMRCVDYNLAYDDKQDALFRISQPSNPNPLDLNLTLEEFTLLALDSTKNPFSKLKLETLELKVQIDIEKKLQVFLKASEFEATYFLPNGQQGILQEMALVGCLNRDPRIYQIESEGTNREIFKQIVTLEDKKKEKVNKRSSPGITLNLVVKEGENNNKVVYLDLENLKAHLVLAAYDKLLDFVSTDENEVIAQDKTKPYPPLIKKPAKEDSSNEVFRFEIKANNFFILSSVKESQDTSFEKCIVTTGNLLFESKSYTNSSKVSSLNGINMFKNIDDKHLKDYLNAAFNVKVLNVENYLVDREEFLSAQKLDKLPKRLLVTFSALEYGRNAYSISNENITKSIFKKRLGIDGAEITMSLQDVMIWTQVIDNQKQITSNNMEKANNAKETVDVDNKKEEVICDLDGMTIDVKNVQIVLLAKNEDEAFIPALQANLFECHYYSIEEKEKVITNGKLIFDLKYHNFSISRWEPIIEKYGTSFVLSKHIASKQSIKFSNLKEFPNLNVDLSQQAVPILALLFKNWNEFDPKSISNTGQSKISDASLFLITNQTGYSIEVESCSDKKLQKYYVQSNSTGKCLFETTEEKGQPSLCPLQIMILHPKAKLAIPDLNKLSPDSPTQYKYQCFDGPPGQHFTVTCEMKRTDSQINIVLSSQFKISNGLSQNYSAVLEYQDKRIELNLGPKSTSAIPSDVPMEALLTFKQEVSGNLTSHPVTLKDLISKNKDKARLTEIKLGTKFILLKTVRLDSQTNCYDIQISSFVQVKNCCAIELEYRLFHNDKKTTEIKAIKSQEVVPETILDMKSRQVGIRLKLRSFAWSPKETIILSSNQEKEIVINDLKGNSLNIYARVIQHEETSYEIILYTKGCIINETTHSFCFVDMNRKHWPELAGQQAIQGDEPRNTNILLTNQMDSLVVQRIDDKQCYVELNTRVCDHVGFSLQNPKTGEHIELIAEVKQIVIDENADISTKAIIIKPHYIILTKTPIAIEVKVEGTEGPVFTIQQNKRNPSEWMNWKDESDNPKAICIRPTGTTDSDWAWSEAFNITEECTENILLHQKESQKESMHLKITITKHKGMSFITIDQLEIDKIPYKIHNNCGEAGILVYQKGTHSSQGQLLNPGEISHWSWKYPQKKKALSVDFVISSNYTYHVSEFVISFDQPNQTNYVEIPLENNMLLKISAVVVIEKTHSVLKFETVSIGGMRNIREDENPENSANNLPAPYLLDLDMEVVFDTIAVSLIVDDSLEQKDRKRKELLFGVIKGLHFKMIKFEDKNYYQLRIKNVTFTNNDPLTSFPVLLTSYQPQFLQNSPYEQFFDLLIVEKTDLKTRFFERIQVSLASASLKFDGRLVRRLRSVLKQINLLASQHKITDSKSIAKRLLLTRNDSQVSLEDREYFLSNVSWKVVEIPDCLDKIFIQELVFHSFCMKICFESKRGDLTNNSKSLTGVLLNTLSTSLVNANDFSLELKAMQLTNVFDSPEKICLKVVKEHKVDSVAAGFSLLLSLSVIGSPLEFLDKVYMSTFTMIEQSILKFQDGPFEGSKSTLEGAFSLLKEILNQTLNSASIITYSIASGLSNLTLDEDYMNSREIDVAVKPQGICQGLWQGVVLFLKGLGKGLIGIFILPCKGGMDGFKGLLLGIYQGVAGLILKPCIGTLDAMSKITEGGCAFLKQNDDKPTNERLRTERSFYGSEGSYREYSEMDSQALFILANKTGSKLKELDFVKAFKVVDEEKDVDKTVIIILTQDEVLCWSTKKEKIIWSFSAKDIEIVETTSKGVQIGLKTESQGIKDKSVYMTNCDSVQNEALGEALRELQKVSLAIK